MKIQTIPENKLCQGRTTFYFMLLTFKKNFSVNKEEFTKSFSFPRKRKEHTVWPKRKEKKQ